MLWVTATLMEAEIVALPNGDKELADLKLHITAINLILEWELTPQQVGSLWCF